MTVAILELDGIGRLELVSWGWGRVSMGGRAFQGRATRPSSDPTREITCVKRQDGASATLMNFVANYNTISSGKLTSVSDDLIALTMSKIVIPYVTLHVRSGPDYLEGFAIRFDDFKSKYAHLAGGPLGVTTVEGGGTTPLD